MALLTDLNLKTVYDSSQNDLVEDLIVPLLKSSIKYDRGVGFFTSGWVRLASRGLNEFASNSGIARVVMSPMIQNEDWEAMIKGEKAKEDEVLYKLLMQSIEDLQVSLEVEPLNAMAWLIADEVLQIKFAIPCGKLEGGDFHDKFAIFEDTKGNRVAIHGSYNDTFHGSLNGESFSVFKSWEEGQLNYVENHNRRFHSLWEGTNSLFKIYDIPQAIKQRIIQLQSKPRPYLIKSADNKKTPPDINSLFKSTKTEIKLYDYQEEAILKWQQANYRGIFEMATGTGKTFTSLACASRMRETKSNLAVVVAAPYIHLIDQWQDEMRKFDFSPVLCSSEHGNWQAKLSLQIQDYNLGFKKSISCVVSHATASSDDFIRLISQINQNVMCIYDEVHGLGAPILQKALISKFEYRIGLSATPARWFDVHGTNVISEYFNGVCFSFPLEKAIGKFLVPYQYLPHIIEMTENEFEEYCRLSSTISRLYHSEEDIENNPYLQSLLRARRQLINSANGKVSCFRELLKTELKQFSDKKQVFSHALFYCPIGGHEEILKVVAEEGIKAREFVYQVNNKERQEILTHFENGNIQALVAMKCLDEGVDVPATKIAFILASTTNPREFIQRRGRILRKFESKNEAFIHDFIVIPPLSVTINDQNVVFCKGILKREMARFAEFASLALNEFMARAVMHDSLEKFHSLHLLDMKPWEIYSETESQYLDNIKEI